MPRRPSKGPEYWLSDYLRFLASLRRQDQLHWWKYGKRHLDLKHNFLAFCKHYGFKSH